MRACNTTSWLLLHSQQARKVVPAKEKLHGYHPKFRIVQILQRMEAQHLEVMLHLSRLDPELARRLGMDIQQVSKEIVEEEQGDSNISGNS